MILCAGLLACGEEPPPESSASARVTAIARDPSAAVRCVVRDALRERSTLGPREAALAAGGQSAPFWLTTAWIVRDEARTSSAFAAAETAAPLPADRWLSFARGSLVLHDSAADAGRPVRALPSACDVRILSTRGGAWVLYRRSAQGCVGGASQGPVVVLRVAANAQQFEAFSPLSDEAVSSLDARLDAGRIVIESTIASNREQRATVLDLEGTVAGQSSGARVVCPLSGCVSVREERGALTFAPIGASNGGWTITTSAGPIRALAVYADRVLVAQQEPAGPRHSMVIVDVARRRVETVYDARARTAVDVWSEPLSSGTARVGATDRGFAVLGAALSGDLYAREVDCEP